MNKYRNIIIYSAVFATLALVSGLITFRVMVTRMTVEVPDLAGMELAQADRALEDRGLYLKVIGSKNDGSIPRGHVISQDVQAGSKMKGMGEVKVIVSKGPAVENIPGVVGEQIDEAMKLFTQKGLEARVVKVHSDTVEENTVIAQWPLPEDWDGQNITLVTSLGAYTVEYFCPSFEGLLKDDALTLARQLGLNVELTAAKSEPSAVEDQKPLPGETIAKGDTVYLQLKGVENYD